MSLLSFHFSSYFCIFFLSFQQISAVPWTFLRSFDKYDIVNWIWIDAIFMVIEYIGYWIDFRTTSNRIQWIQCFIEIKVCWTGNTDMGATKLLPSARTGRTCWSLLLLEHVPLLTWQAFSPKQIIERKKGKYRCQSARTTGNTTFQYMP